MDSFVYETTAKNVEHPVMVPGPLCHTVMTEDAAQWCGCGQVLILWRRMPTGKLQEDTLPRGPHYPGDEEGIL